MSVLPESILRSTVRSLYASYDHTRGYEHTIDDVRVGIELWDDEFGILHATFTYDGDGKDHIVSIEAQPGDLLADLVDDVAERYGTPSAWPLWQILPTPE